MNTKKVIKIKDWYRKTYTDIYCFDLDNTLLESIGTYEKDYDLKKFIRDNTFFKNQLRNYLLLFFQI